jgi:hypothetical protein
MVASPIIVIRHFQFAVTGFVAPARTAVEKISERSHHQQIQNPAAPIPKRI